jgi:DNA-binding MarR family transcriptional regulator
MEKVVMSGPAVDAEGLDVVKFPIMRTLARFHECDVETLFSRVDASELDVHDILRDMVSNNEVEASRQPSDERRKEKFTLTLKGWGEYMRVLGSIYELPE